MPPVALYVFFGFVATGKSSLASAWARRHHLSHYNTDVVRKSLAGLAPTTRREEAVDHGIYGADFSRRTYDVLLAETEQELRQGRGVVLDGSYQLRQERLRLRELARRHGFPIYFIFCTCPEPVLKERLALRARDPAAVSDGRWEIYLQQQRTFEPPTELGRRELITLETTASVEELASRLERLISELAHQEKPAAS